MTSCRCSPSLVAAGVPAKVSTRIDGVLGGLGACGGSGWCELLFVSANLTEGSGECECAIYLVQAAM